MHALFFSSFTHLCCRDYATASALIDELAVLADKKNALFWKAAGMLEQGSLFASRRRGANDDLWAQSMAINRSDIVGANLLVVLGARLC
jgi:hypothetical protein